MDTIQIYENIMLDKYFNRMKYHRNSWNERPSEKYKGVTSLVDIQGDEQASAEGALRLTCLSPFHRLPLWHQTVVSHLAN